MNTLKNTYALTDKDIERLKNHGIEPDKLVEQINQIRQGTKYITLARPCIVSDGIIRIEEGEKAELRSLYEKVSEKKRVVKFVPASGAASRMFKKLEGFMNSPQNPTLDEIASDKHYEYINRFFSNLKNFAFYDDLQAVIDTHGKNLNKLLSQNKLKEILEFLLTDIGLNYSKLPKALIKFHSYNSEKCTSLEEQVRESIQFIRDKSGKVNLHFAVPPEFKDDFVNESKKLITKYCKTADLNITFSYQKKSTDTIALDPKGEVYRDDGSLLFRPGGHGALIENLNELNYDLIFVKNIDNVQMEENLDLTIGHKKLLGGILVKYQDQIHSYLAALDNSVGDKLLKEILQFISGALGYDIFSTFFTKKPEVPVDKIKEFLNRPIRVCGVVINEGHPGGGPFWIKEKNGSTSKQIVESEQIDKSDGEQNRIFQSSTHFNPVDIVCAVKDYKGNKFDLTKYVDHSEVLVATKSHNGEELKALELPGLWNGAMADWITIFVEVPKETFTPVKEVNDLLQNYHQ